MATSFDPYREWLGIPPEEQPPTHYRLLGLQAFENDPNAIHSAADRQMAHVKSFQLGKQAPACQRLLNELAAARLALLDPNRRNAYDLILRSAAPASALEAAPGAPPGAAPRIAPRPNPIAPNRPVPIGTVQLGDFSIGGTLAKYRVLELLAGSSHGRTHKAQHLDTHRYHFLKFIPPESLGNVEVVKRFERECEILTRLDHPNLIVGHETFEQRGMRFLVMEFVMGADLATLVKQQGPLAIDQAVDYLTQAASGLSQLHAHGIYHRNLKPHVLLVDLQGRLRITNLLLAKIGEQSDLPNEELTTMGEAMGSLDYMPPEQAIDARKADARSDVYSLGCTLFHLVIGRPPYVAKGAMQKVLAHKQSPIPSLAALRSETPAWLERVYQKMLAKQPDARYQNADELIAALQASTAPWWRRVLAKIGYRRADGPGSAGVIPKGW